MPTDGGYTREEVAIMHGYDRMPDSYYFWLGEEWERIDAAVWAEINSLIEEKPDAAQ